MEITKEETFEEKIKKSKENRKVSIGLIKGRHEIPVESYVFGSIEDVTDVNAIESKAVYRLREVYRPGEQLVLYATGLTVALVAVLNAARSMQWLNCVVMHYDANTKSYYPQYIAW